MFFVAWSLHFFIFGELLHHSMFSLVPHAFRPSDVDNRLFLSKRDLPHCHCGLAGCIRRQHWNDIDGNYVEVCDKPESR
jgi:hypothetical protein